MKKCLVVFSALILIVFCSCSKPAGDPISKDFSIEGSYTELSVSNGFVVTVDDAATQITVMAGENVMPNVVVEKIDDRLKIYLQPTLSGNLDLKVTLPYNPDLQGVDLSGASEYHSDHALNVRKVCVDLSGASKFYCDINTPYVDVDLSGASGFYGDIIADEIEASLSGGSKIEGDVIATDLELELSGASEASLEGQATNLDIDLSAGSKITEKVVGHKYALACDRCEGEMSGKSFAYVHCNDNIRVSLSGASVLHYTGNASTIGSTTSGDSEIIPESL